MSKVGLFILTCVTALVAVLGAARAADSKLFPDDTEIVVSIRPKQIAAAELIAGEKGALDQPRAVLDGMAAGQPIFKLFRGAGIDAFRDLTRVRFAGPGGKEFKATLVSVEGDFAAIKLRDKLSTAGTNGVKVTRSGRTTVFEIGAGGENRQFAAFVNETTLVAALSPEVLADVLARSDGSKKSGLPK